MFLQLLDHWEERLKLQDRPSLTVPSYPTDLPHMGGAYLWEPLFYAAAGSTHSVVEVGSWLGAGSLALAYGARASRSPLHIYDRWKASAEEVEKAARYGFHLREGQNLKPIVRNLLNKHGVRARLHRGRIEKVRWNGKPISLYVDDAAKSEALFRTVLSAFAPSWVDGALIFLMDFHYYRKGGDRYRFQFETIKEWSNYFEPVSLPTDGRTSQAAFLYRFRDGRFSEWAAGANLG